MYLSSIIAIMMLEMPPGLKKDLEMYLRDELCTRALSDAKAGMVKKVVGSV